MGLKHLREQNKDLNINFVDLISKLDPTKTNKMTPFLISMLKKRVNEQSIGESYMGDEPAHFNEILDTIDSKIQRDILYLIVDYYFGYTNINKLKKFADYLNRGLIENNDILSYKDFNQMDIELSKAITKEIMNNSKKEVLTVFDNDDWWLFKPLTHESSVVYGYGTKWCTSMKNEPEYFYRHSDRGVLIYAINKKNNRKFGCHKYFNDPVRIYDETDQQIDSFDTGMDFEVLKELFKLMKDDKPNTFHFSNEEKSRSMNYLMERNRLIPMPALRTEIHNYIDEPDVVEDNLDIDNSQPHEPRVFRMGDITDEVMRQMVRSTINGDDIIDELP